ncbi:glycosyltransferase family 4 protein [Patescibacteria group bacterium]|nr:glycosyltransferase family 4 protein [Patescibacteria group bacterium]
MKKKKIAICHYRVGGTDGVSLEIEKRKQILEKHGCEVKLIAGSRSKGADYAIDELEWDQGVVPIIKENGFVYFNRKDLEDDELKRKMNKISDRILNKLDEIQRIEKFDAVLIHNIFSFDSHLAAAKPFAKWVDRHKLPCLATHHDFYWERNEFDIVRNAYVRNYMKKFMPPKSKYIEHITINSLAGRELKKRFNIDSYVLPDIFNFNQKPWSKDSFNKDLLKELKIKSTDIIVLQATRVLPRKGVELAMDFTKTLQKKLDELKGKKLYNGKKINSNPNVILLIAGYTEDMDNDYLLKIKAKAFDDKIHIKFISNVIKANRAYRQRIKIYSLWDIYVHADIITFPSIWEGWGNQFIEAIFAKKPIVVFEYPVFKEDIKREGYNIISLGDELEILENGLHKAPQENIQKAVQKSIRWLIDKNLNKKLEENFAIGQKHHGYKILEDFLARKLDL